ncbi:MAG: SOS response-associated peptidase [Rubrobacter sp.]|nr:SOS response-associated peptidase [Rubrobacter sp.]
MCGRYTLALPSTKLFERFGLEGDAPEITPNYNVAPTQSVAAVLEEDGGRRLEMLRWGLVPSWAKDLSIGSRMINARSETAHEKPSFRSAFKRRRCLIPADGFYEWKREEIGGKQPFHIRMGDGEPFAFAGLWESWDGGEGEVRTCAILTTEANEMMGEIHHRMPVILPADLYEAWLGDEAEKQELASMMEPYPSGPMEAYPVDRFVNKPSNNDPRCIEPAA